jgi:hypothetical protein
VDIEMVDGEPKVEWEPKVNRWTGTLGRGGYDILSSVQEKN